MPSSFVIPLALLLAYVAGSIDFAVIVARMHGVDIHQVGSGNPGTSNVLRTLGRVPAALVLFGDMVKGLVAAAMGMVASAQVTGVLDPMVHWAFAAGFAAVVGHCYPVFHRFRGGKGVATGGGVLAFTVPLVAVICVSVWVLVVKVTKTAAVASMVIVISVIPLLIWRGVTGLGLVWVGAILVVVVWRHRGNIRRLLRGDEQKVPT